MESNSTNLFDLQFDDLASNYMRDSARWAKFVAILGIIGCGIGLLILSSAMFTYSSEAADAKNVLTGFVLILTLDIGSFFPCIYLYRFSRQMTQAIGNNDQESLTRAFKSMRGCLRFLGIYAIVGTLIWVAVILMNLFGGR